MNTAAATTDELLAEYDRLRLLSRFAGRAVPAERKAAQAAVVAELAARR
jgi:hypothetical protein